MKFVNTLRQQKGLSLVELMVAMAISLVLLIAIGLVYQSSKSGFNYANNTVRLSEDASFAIDTLGRDIRMAAYGGCTGASRSAGADGILNNADDIFIPKLDKVNTLALTGGAKPNPFSASIFDSTNAVIGFASSTAANASISPAPGFLDGTSTSYSLITAAPILFVSGGASQALQVSGTVTGGVGTSSNIGFAGDPLKWNNNFTSGNKVLMLIADCKSSEVFRADSMSTAGMMTTEKALLNSYGSDAIVTPLISSTYFLAKRKKGTVLADTSSLYRRYFNGNIETIEELVTNVEAITYLYGENTGCINADATCAITTTPSYVADVYRTSPTTVVNWNRVVSIRVGLIIATEEAGQTNTTTATIPWIKDGGTNYTPVSTTDRRLRRAYSTTVSIRNRVAL
jgi:type IV pilus assembly protein PilW